MSRPGLGRRWGAIRLVVRLQVTRVPPSCGRKSSIQSASLPTASEPAGRLTATCRLNGYSIQVRIEQASACVLLTVRQHACR